MTRAFASAFALAVLTAACAADAPVAGDATTTLAPASTGAASSGGAAETTTSATAAHSTETTVAVPAIADGRVFGYVRLVDPAGPSILLDQAEMLSGDAAAAAAVAAGVIGEGETLPNDYFIANPDAGTVALTVAETAALSVIDWAACCELVDATLADVDATATLGIPFWVTVADGVVVAIEEQYLP